MQWKLFLFKVILFVLITGFIYNVKIEYSFNPIIENEFYKTLFNKSANNKTELANNTGNNKLHRIFCIVLTSVNNLNSKSFGVYKSWVKKCDNSKFITMIPVSFKNSSNFSMNHSQSLEIKYANCFDILQPAYLVHDAYDKLSTKVFLTFRDIFQRYNYYDWYLKADDDTFIFVDNLRDFLKDKNPQSPVTYGYNFNLYVQDGYHSGGAGYLLSHNALNRLGNTLSENFTFCENTGVEDIDINKCLRKLGVRPGKSIDQEGKERFHPLSIFDFYYGNFPSWLFTYSENYPKMGLDCCSDNSISFHYMSENENQNLSEILENFEKNKFNSKIKNNKKLTFAQIMKELKI